MGNGSGAVASAVGLKDPDGSKTWNAPCKLFASPGTAASRALTFAMASSTMFCWSGTSMLKAASWRRMPNVANPSFRPPRVVSSRGL